jgi:D-cysteine desulfhydrase family pyridoxal phosphate-dependent enzyme
MSIPLDALPRVPLANLPTPIGRLPRLSAALGGPQIWIKRDDLTGLAFGGNKTRKLELLLAEAQAEGACTLVTTGAVQSNHCRQTAAAAAKAGMACVLVLAGSPPEQTSGNLLLDSLVGAELVYTRGRDRDATLQETVEQLQADGRNPYRIPYGGSSPRGAAAYALALSELLDQGLDFDRIVFATSSGGTQAGLIAGAVIHGYRGRITGISVDQPASVVKASVAKLASETGGLLGHPTTVSADEVEVVDDFLGGGYGVMGELERQAILTFARQEGILLDPVYTGRAAGGMLELIRSGAIARDERVLFWHTGGTPALFAYASQLVQP